MLPMDGRLIDSHNSRFVGIAVELYVQAHSRTVPYLDPEEIQPKTDGTAEIYTSFFLYA